MKYLVIPRIEVNNANAQPAWWMIGPPPLTAYAGFSHALALALGVERCLGFGVVHHDIQFLGETVGRDLRPHQFRAASFIDKDDYSSKNAYALSSQPTARCHLTASLVIRFDQEDSLDIENQLPRFLRGARLAGGNIVKFGIWNEEKFENCALMENFSEVAKFIKNGHAIHERQDLMVKQDGERDMLDVVLRLTDPQRRRSDPEAPTWLLPTTLGYRAITPFQKRKNVRDNLPHAYAEPLVGMVQYRTLREAPLPIWQATNPDAATFLVTTQP